MPRLVLIYEFNRKNLNAVVVMWQFFIIFFNTGETTNQSPGVCGVYETAFQTNYTGLLGFEILTVLHQQIIFVRAIASVSWILYVYKNI